MRLYLNKTSPYARLALVMVHETGLADRVELVWVEPWSDPPELLAVNPAGKIPALLTDDGTALIESGCISDYLLMLSRHDDLQPSHPTERTDMLYRLGLARAAMDCAFGAVIQRRFNNGADTPLSERWLRALPRIVNALDTKAESRRAGRVDHGDLAIGVAFDYVDFRLTEINWRAQASSLVRLVDTLRARPSMRATRPQ